MTQIKLLVYCCLFLCTYSASAQFVSVRGTHASQMLVNNLYDPDMSHALGAELIYSKPVQFIKWPINYNIGLDYRNVDGAQAAYLATGITWVTRTPSGFMFAPNAESVSYVTSNWLQYASFNMLNGVLIGDSTAIYDMGFSLDYNFGYVFGKQFFVHWGLGGRYHITPEYSADLNEPHNSFDFMLKAGFLWKFKRKYANPNKK